MSLSPSACSAEICALSLSFSLLLQLVNILTEKLHHGVVFLTHSLFILKIAQVTESLSPPPFLVPLALNKTNNDTCVCKHLFDKANSTKCPFVGCVVAKAHILHQEMKLCYL